MRTYIIAELGICHNGKLDLAKKMIDVAKDAGADSVKFQKRTIELQYTPDELEQPRAGEWGNTNGCLKKQLEFGHKEYDAIDQYCKQKKLDWFASCWDVPSVDFISRYSPPCYKIASASLTDKELLRHTRRQGKPIILSTGMSSLQEIDQAVETLGRKDLTLMHTTSVYPCPVEILNLRAIETLKERFGLPVGYSGHETNAFACSLAAVALGATVIERHITLDRSLADKGYSDHASSLEPEAFKKLVKYIRTIEQALGDGKKIVYPEELTAKKKLRKIETILH